MSRTEGETRLVGVMGWPVEHSLSPHLHNAAFAALKLNWTYVPLRVRPESLEDALVVLYARGFRGVNITVPHKQAIIPLLDSMSEDATAIGAVNTVVMEDDGSLSGHNTDWTGFMTSLQRNDIGLEGKRVLVIGAGGAARAAVFGLGKAGADVLVLNRHEHRAARLVDELSPTLPEAHMESGPLTTQSLATAAEKSSLLIQCTSVGMWPHRDESIWPDELRYPDHLDVYDMVYRPRITKLMATAQAAGANTISGIGMLVHQAAPAFEMWTGLEAPLNVMWSACMQALGGELCCSS